jgi:hypothetical protein
LSPADSRAALRGLRRSNSVFEPFAVAATRVMFSGQQQISV